MAYKVQYLRKFQQDFDEITAYIAVNLASPKAAATLAQELFKAIERIAEFPYSRKLYVLSRPLAVEYRMFNVKNYAVFYAVDENKKTLQLYRMLYARRDFEHLLS